jgi:hypothetical protein
MISPAQRMSGTSPGPVPAYLRDAPGLWADIPAFTTFAQDVADAMEGDQLRQSRRHKLLKRAGQLGIRRFDANLVIAMVQHRLQGSHVRVQEACTRSARLATIAAVVVVQAIIVAAVWWMLV